MKSYLTGLKRAAGKTSEVRKGLEVIEPDLLKNSLLIKGVVKTRGDHVHQQTFSDEGLDRLSTFELYISLKHHPLLSKASAGLSFGR